ncbi:TPA_asm: hypothetical protein GIN74_11245 [Listeria monocytogenes]|nr:hypothetical protein [Listeria monocytogenes]
MAYEKTKIVVASGDGKIYLCTLDRDGHMTDSRKDVTKDVLRSTAEYFMKNNCKRAQFGETTKEGELPTLFFTSKPNLAEKILQLLQFEQ